MNLNNFLNGLEIDKILLCIEIVLINNTCKNLWNLNTRKDLLFYSKLLAGICSIQGYAAFGRN